MNKKIYASWNLAATHFLTTAFMNTILKVFFIILITAILPKGALIIISIFLAYIIAIWIAVFLSTKYINKKYLVTNSASVVNLSSIYALLLFLLYSFVLYRFDQIIFVKIIKLFSIATIDLPIQGTSTDIMIKIVLPVIIFILFYLFSKKFIKNSEQ